MTNSTTHTHYPTPFDDYEVHGVACVNDAGDMEQVSDELAECFGLYGHIKGQGLECIGDFKTREAATEAMHRITGSHQAPARVIAEMRDGEFWMLGSSSSVEVVVLDFDCTMPCNKSAVTLDASYSEDGYPVHAYVDVTVDHSLSRDELDKRHLGALHKAGLLDWLEGNSSIDERSVP